MTKADKILIVCVMIVSLCLLVPLCLHKENASVVVVQVQNEEVLRLDLNVDAEYEVQGTLGPVHIEVKDRAVRVVQESSKHHYCSMQGFVSHVDEPIVCLPNDTIVTIEGEGQGEDVVIR